MSEDTTSHYSKSRQLDADLLSNQDLAEKEQYGPDFLDTK